jgi:signal transduction histidine kinase
MKHDRRRDEGLSVDQEPSDGPASHLRDATRRDSTVRIVVAEGDADRREHLVRLLRKRWTVDGFSNGQEALDAIRRNEPALVIADARMPGLDGFGLTRALRQDSQLESIPIIMLSPRAGEDSEVEVLEAGANDYLAPAFSARELIARVGTQLEIRRLRRCLHQERTALTRLFVETPMPIAILRGDSLVYEVANSAYLDVVGRDVLGRPFVEALPELARQGFAEMLHRVMKTGEPVIGREVLAKIERGGCLRDMHVTFICSPLKNEAGESDAIVAIGNDVTEQVEARKKLELLAKEAQAATRAKDEFLAMLGHELRNPLAPMLTALELLRLRGDTSPELEVMERQVAHLTRLVDDLMDVSRITRGRLELRRKNVELSEVISKAIEITSPIIEQRRHRLDVHVGRRGLGVNVDPDRMAQVISNLLTNAAKYSDRGSTILVEASQRGNITRLRVKDEGVGIAPDMIDRVFDLFTQQPQTIDRSKGGLGLGLTIVRALVDQHGGKVQARSKGIGKGSEFIVELPRVVVTAAPAVSVRSSKTPALGAGKRVLVVDDNEDLVATIRLALEMLGYVVETAHDGPTALARATAFHPDVALVDIGLPVMDGYELAKQLRDPRVAGEKVQLVAVTGYSQEADRRRARAAGFDHHLVKPVELAKLQSVVKNLPT